MPYVVHVSVSDSRTVTREFHPALPMDDLYRQLVGTRPLTEAGRANIPTKMRVGRPRRGPIPHILGSSTGPWIVSPRVHGIIEELEPGVQEFSPVRLLNKDDVELETYFLILPPPKLDAVIKDQTDFSSSMSLDRHGKCVLDADVIRGHHFWRGETPLEMQYFCSDELVGRLKTEKLDGWNFQHRCTVQQQA